MFLRSVGDAFHGPAMMATTPLMVPDSWLTRVAGMNRSLAGILQFITPALGAIMISLFDVGAVVAIDVITAIIAIVPLLLTAVPNPPRKIAPTDRGFVRFGRESGPQRIRCTEISAAAAPRTSDDLRNGEMNRETKTRLVESGHARSGGATFAEIHSLIDDGYGQKYLLVELRPACRNLSTSPDTPRLHL